ncbi:MAG: family 10 glycosylhydrolase [Clostridium sp.]|nr:family 10 glycosylhydrolase [Clostridium sp.]
MNRHTPYYIYMSILLAVLWSIPLSLHSQTSSPKHEVRAVWLTTLSGLDWPTTKATTEEGRRKQQEELCRTLDRLQAIRINTVLLQTRIRGSVIYPSDIEPWDGCLTGTPDKSPGYDPLAFAIEECHKRGMELHAWMVTIPCMKTTAVRSMGSRSVVKKHPSLCRKHNDMWYLDPGIPATADYLASICREVTEKYDIDGIHFDYIRYPEGANRFADNTTYRKYGKGKDKSSWRRENITRCVRKIYETVKAVKPWVKVSSSPVGKFDDLSRYPSRGWNARQAVFQDAQGWCREGIHDMLFPMMYFRGDNFFPFADNWQDNSNGRPVCPGLGIYFLHPREQNWPLEDIERELHFTRTIGMGGQAYFRSRFLTDNVKGLYDYLGDLFYTHPALTPPCTWLDSIAPTRPESLTVTVSGCRGTLSWETSTDNICGTDVLYNVYASHTYPVDTSRPENLIASRLRANRYAYNARYAMLYGIHFAVTAMDRFGNESPAANQPVPTCTPTNTCRLNHDARTLNLPDGEAEFVMITDGQGRILHTQPYTASIDISGMQAGYYEVRTLEAKGISRRIGSFFK